MLAGTFGDAMAVATAELRIVRRMTRIWLFAALAIGVGLFAYHSWSVQHSWMGLTTAPRFALPGFGIFTLWILLAGLVFLAFDVRARDERERIAEALDSRPLSNVTLLGGRLLAVAFAAWLPLAVLALVLQVGGAVVEGFDLRLGVPAEPVSLVTFVFLDAPPALLFWSAMVALLAAVLRNRLAVAVVALGLLGLQFWGLFKTPLYLLPALSGVANLGLPGSDILPRLPSAVDLAQRGSVLLLGAGLLAAAASLLPRRDATPRSRGLASSGALLALGACGIGALVWFANADRAERVAWAEAHEAALAVPRVDVQRVSGTVTVDPIRELVIDLDLELRVPDTDLDELQFSLNPGMEIESVRLDGEETPFEHALGLLSIATPSTLRPGTRATVSIHARGVPDERFGYVDSAVWALDETLTGMPIVLQGEKASLFERSYLALTPAVHWLPTSRANFATDDPARNPPDFHEIDLVVEIPDGWHAAGPGRVEQDRGLRFRPNVPLAQFPLFAGPFERRSLTVDDVEYELLVHPGHMASVEYFSGENTALTVEHLEQRLGWYAIPGVTYPHEVLSLVEVPGQLRRYGGGRFLDSVQALPGVQMLPEHGFPTRRFVKPQNYTDEQWFRQMLYSIPAGGPHRVLPHVGGSRNLVPFLTSASGEGAVAVNYILESLTAWVAVGRRTVAPGHWLQPGRFAGQQVFPFGVLNRLMGTATFSFGWYQFFPMSLEERSAEFSFTGVDAMASQEGVDVLIHKGNLVALAIQGLMGRPKVVEFLTLMRQRHGGGTFGLDDFIAAIAETDPTMGPYMEHLMRGSALPGFLVSDLRVVRLPDLENGQPRYQVTVHVRNDEPVPGVAGIGFRVPQSGAPFVFGFRWGKFVHVPGNTAMEFGVTTQAPPLEVRLETYLSRNARVMRLPLPGVDPDRIVVEEALNGARPSDWQPPDIGIIVDDLDPGFAFVSPPEKGFRLGSWSDDDDTDDTVPEFYAGAGGPGWHRQGDPLTTSWGKYRRTLMRILAGTGQGTASFTTDLPAGGDWRLSYHLPGASASEGIDRSGRPGPMNDDFGTYDFRIVAGDQRMRRKFDARTAVPGWNDIGTFDLPAGPVSVEVSDATDGNVVVADAVRWQPATRSTEVAEDA